MCVEGEAAGQAAGDDGVNGNAGGGPFATSAAVSALPMATTRPMVAPPMRDSKARAMTMGRRLTPLDAFPRRTVLVPNCASAPIEIVDDETGGAVLSCVDMPGPWSPRQHRFRWFLWAALLGVFYNSI